VRAVLRRMYTQIVAHWKQHREKIRAARAAHRDEIRKLLTPDQRAQFNSMVTAYEKRRAQRRTRRRGGR